MAAPIALSVSEACAVARIGRTRIYEEIRAKRLPARKNGRRTIILADDLRRYLEALPAVGSKP